MGLTGHLPELAVVLVVALLIFGPGRLPAAGSAIGQTIREFRKASIDSAGAESSSKGDGTE